MTREHCIEEHHKEWGKQQKYTLNKKIRIRTRISKHDSVQEQPCMAVLYSACDNKNIKKNKHHVKGS